MTKRDLDAVLTCPSFEFIQKGQGPVVVFLHGLFGHPLNWAPMMDALALNYRTVALKYPFFEHKQLNSIEALIAYTVAFMEQYEIGRAHFCGNSLGGQIALDLSLKYPKRVHTLILTGSAGLWEAQPNGQLPKATRAFIRQQAEKIFYDPKHVDDALIEKLYESLQDRGFVRTLLRLARDTQAYSLGDRLAEIKIPTLLLWGENDQITPKAIAQTFQQKISDSRLVFLSECGHAPPLEQPERFTAEIEKFLSAATQS